MWMEMEIERVLLPFLKKSPRKETVREDEGKEYNERSDFARLRIDLTPANALQRCS